MQKIKPRRPREVSTTAAQEGRSKGQSLQVNQQGGRAEKRQQVLIVDETSKLKEKPSLKDLRPEDKKRIANLIRELAKVGEEKEVIVQQLNVERRSYEDKVKKLQNHMTTILKERELTQTQYLQCQKLLAEYQSQLASEQEKLSASFNLSTLPSPHKHNSMTATRSKQEPVPSNTLSSSKRFSNAHQRTSNVKTTQQSTHQSATPSHLNGYQGTPQQNGYQIPPSAQCLPPSSVEFNPLLASTNRPQTSSHREPAMHVSYGNKENLGGFVLRPGIDPEQGVPLPVMGTHMYPTDSQESRAQSGNFIHLPPEMDNESRRSDSPNYNGAWSYHKGYPDPSGYPVDNRFHGNAQRGVNVHPKGAQHQGYGVQQQVYPTLSEAQQHRHVKLERQKQELREEQAWLRKKLQDQEEMLLLKQSQLEQHKVHLLEQEWQRDHSHRMTQNSNWQMNNTDLEWEEPKLFNGKQLQAPSESENDSDDASTNFPPENFVSHSQPSSLLTNSLHELNLNRSHLESRGKGATSQRHVAMETGGKTQGLDRREEERIDGYASLYPNTQTRHKIQGSTSSYDHSNTSSANSHPPLVDRSSSPLHHRDCSQAISGQASPSPARRGHQSFSSGRRGHLSLSPGRVTLTPAPQGRRDGGSGSRQVSGERRTVSLPKSPRQHSNNTSVRKSNVTHLSDLIDDLESPPTTTHARPVDTTHNTTHARPVNTSHNTSVARQGRRTTPDLFREEVVYTDTDAEVQESRILEDVFFL